jgi:hypothetical protein
MIARMESEIRDKIEELSYIFDISDELRITYERTEISYSVQYDDYVRYGMIIALDVRFGKVVGERIGN